MTTNDPVHKVVILGSGPAGLTAAIYAARANLAPVVVAGIEAGGQLMITTDVENYPGFPDGVQGPELMALFRQQAERFGTVFRTGNVARVNVEKHPFELMLEDDGEVLRCEALIVSAGASARWLGLDSETRLRGHGVSACATCDGFFFRGKEVAVVGGGDTAVEEALFLTNFATRVHVLHRRGELRASKVMVDRAVKNPKIDLVWNVAVQEIIGAVETGVSAVRLQDVRSGAQRDLAVGGVFIAIGHTPNSHLFHGVLDMDELGYLKEQPGTTRTNVAGVFACGDVADKMYRQAVTAAGTGCMAALDAERWLAARES